MKNSLVLAAAVLLGFVSQANAESATTGSLQERTGLPTLFIVGDSTVRNRTPGQMGWGDVIAEYFDQSRIRVLNCALGGRSSRTFQTQGHWDRVLSEARAGDFVLIQFGHNDGSPINDQSRARGSLPGIGEQTEEIDNLLTGQHEVVHTYGWYMRKYITDAKARGMIPIVCSPVPRCPRSPTTNSTTQPATASSVPVSDYVQWSAEVAHREGAHFIDLNRLILLRYAGMTPQQVKQDYFTQADNTHTSPAGADLNARCVVEGLKQLKDCPLRQFLLDN